MPHRHDLAVIVSAHDGYPRWLSSGADFIEVDIRRDRRGAIILAHDEPPPDVDCARLDDALTDFDGSIGLHLDLKERGFEVELLDMVLKRVPADNVVVTPDFEESARAIKQHSPEVRVSPIDFVALEQRFARNDRLDYYAERRLPVWLWTVDDKRLMQRFVNDPRIEAIITNRPDLALRLIRKARS
jgi:glycerophosphoryl diester phosphodiesterase